MGTPPSRELKVSDIQRIADANGQRVLSLSSYLALGGKYSKNQLFADGDSWSSLCADAGVTPDLRNMPLSRDTYF